MVLGSLQAAYQVWLLDHSGNKIQLLENFEKLEFILAVNSEGAPGWGSYRIEGEVTKLPYADFLLDRIVSIQRKAPGMAWRTEFEGLHRRPEFWYDEKDTEWYRSSGTDLKALMKRRIVIPATGQAFLTYTGPFTDAMRNLVRTQASLLAPVARRQWHVMVENDTGEGAIVTYSVRDDQLSTDLEELTGLGASFDVERVDDYYWFRVYYPRRGKDRRVDNPDGNVPVVFSIVNGNMQEPSFVDDRLGEVNVVYVAGEGAGALREIVERSSLWVAELDSPWNRIEGFLDQSSQTNTAVLNALGDAYLIENREQITFSCKAVPTVLCLYGRDWDAGDLVTGIYRGVSYDLGIDQVQVTLDVPQGEVIIPTFRWIPGVLLP